MKKILTIILAGVVLSSCGVYKKYQSQSDAPSDLFGSGDSIAQVALNESSIASVSWREFFTDPLLQQLIDSALARNTDMLAAKSAVLQAQASLKAAKLAYLPSLSQNPQGNLNWSKFGSAGSGTGMNYSYNIPLQLDWNIGISGSVTVNKRKAQAVLEQAKAAREATQANLIATVAQYYFQLLMLDKELNILIETDSLWNESLETERALWENGQAYSTAVNQMESSCMDVKSQIFTTRRSILSAENELCKLLRMTPRSIARTAWGDYQLPERFGTGVPATLLENRPDI
jgi:outer membrane protein TolC